MQGKNEADGAVAMQLFDSFFSSLQSLLGASEMYRVSKHPSRSVSVLRGKEPGYLENAGKRVSTDAQYTSTVPRSTLREVMDIIDNIAKDWLRRNGAGCFAKVRSLLALCGGDTRAWERRPSSLAKSRCRAADALRSGLSQRRGGWHCSSFGGP